MFADAQIAEKKAQQDREKENRRRQVLDSAGGWNPWGQPGGGAPPRGRFSGEGTSPRENQVFTVVENMIWQIVIIW